MSYQTTPAGWYPDPTPGATPGTVRYWNGAEWTDYVQVPGAATSPASPAPAFSNPFEPPPTNTYGGYSDPTTGFNPAPVAPPVPTYGAYGYGYAPAPKTNGLAIAALVCSLAGLVTCGLASILGVIFGHISRSQIKRSQGRESGSGLALAGLIVGYIVVALVVVYIVAVATAIGNAEDF